jgi:hemolysin III
LSGSEQGTLYSIGEETANVLTHAIGAVLAAVGLIVLVWQSVQTGDTSAVLASVVFGVSLVALYLASTLYHAAKKPSRKSVFQTFDHVGIYFLIAGSYTPFCLVVLGGTLGWWIFGLIYVCAVAGTLAELLAGAHRKKFAVLLCLSMGWLAVFVIEPLMEALSTKGMVSLFAGGLFYSLGTVFYAKKQLPYNHAVWHLFVMAGSASHFYCIVNCVLASHTIPMAR